MRAEYEFIMSGLRFVNIRHAFDGSPADIGTLYEVLTRGAFPGISMRPLGEFLPNRVLPRPSTSYRTLARSCSNRARAHRRK